MKRKAPSTFERYSVPSRRVVYRARKAALTAGTAKIDSMHLLHGLIEEKSSHAHSLFKLEERFPETAAQMRVVKPAPERRDISLADDCKRILAYTVLEADQLNSYWIHTDHLLLGILRDDKNAAAVKLQASGLEIAAARAQVSSSALKSEDHGVVSEFWRPSVPPNIVGQIAAATYVLLVVLLLGIVMAKSC